MYTKAEIYLRSGQLYAKKMKDVFNIYLNVENFYTYV